jgi:hypothetical protein
MPTLEEQIDQVHYGCWTWDWAGWKVGPSKVLPIKSKARSIEASSKIGKSNIGCVSSSSGFLSYRGSNAHLKGAPENHGPSRMERVQASVVYLLGWKLMVWMLILSSYVEEELCGILQPHSRIKSKTNRSIELTYHIRILIGLYYYIRSRVITYQFWSQDTSSRTHESSEALSFEEPRWGHRLIFMGH